MSIAGIFLFIALIIVVGSLIAWPLLNPTPDMAEADRASDESNFQARHEAILKMIRDLDFDHQTGKIADDDYERQRRDLVDQGVETLQEIDALKANQTASNLSEDAIEAAIKRRRGH